MARIGRAAALRSHSSAISAMPFIGGLNPVPTTASTMRSARSASRARPAPRARYHVNLAPRRMGEFAPRDGGVALELFRRAQQQRGHLESGFSSSRAAIMPSPPLLPVPQSTVTRCANGNCSRAKPATAAAALRIRSIDGMPKLLRGGAVAGLHLGCGKNVHRIHGTAVAGQCECSVKCECEV